ARALEKSRHFGAQPLHDLVVPIAAEAAAQTKIRESKWINIVRGVRVRFKFTQPRDFGFEPPAPLFQGGFLRESPCVQFAHNGKDEYLEEHHVDLRPARHNLEIVTVHINMDETLL